MNYPLILLSAQSAAHGVTTGSAISFNDWLQWISVGVILLMAVIMSVRKAYRFRKAIKKEEFTCGCGCSGCPAAQKSEKLKGKHPNGDEICYLCKDKSSEAENGH